MKTIKIITLLGLMLLGSAGFAQHGRGHGRGNHHRNGHVVKVRHSAYRPARVRVYYPAWRPAYSCQRRWVYFPRHNFYWDNWRNHYVFYNGTVWISQASAPPTIINVNLANEKTKELKEDDDDVDDIYVANSQHKTEYKDE